MTNLNITNTQQYPWEISNWNMANIFLYEQYASKSFTIIL